MASQNYGIARRSADGPVERRSPPGCNANHGAEITPDIDKARRELGYVPLIDMEEGMRELEKRRSELGAD